MAPLQLADLKVNDRFRFLSDPVSMSGKPYIVRTVLAIEDDGAYVAETYDGRASTYLPHYYVERVQPDA